MADSTRALPDSTAPLPADSDVVVIGGGPAGSVAAKLLASWGHDVRLLTRLPDSARALANSLPPSTRKLLIQVGILDLVEQVGYPTTGNTVWWGEREGQVEPFAADRTARGYQVPRAALDPLLLDRAADAGAHVERNVRVSRVQLEPEAAVISVADEQGTRTVRARFVLDCSGRSGVIAVPQRLRRHVPGGRMQALIGEWSRPDGWAIDEPSHTYIETCDTGWAWSIPISETRRHVGVMVDGATSQLDRGPDLDATYRAQLARTPRLARQVDLATLHHAFACDASVYDALEYGGARFLLVGDAGSTLNPLSSFGIKKALTSSWLAAVVAHTCLTHPARAEEARRFFARWESQLWQINLRSTRDFAREAAARHRTAFWETQAAAVVDDSQIPPSDAERLADPAVHAAHERLKASVEVRFGFDASRVAPAPLVRGQEIALDAAVRLGARELDLVRYVRGIDLVSLARLAPAFASVPGLFDEYQARHGATPLPDFLGALSLLVASGVVTLESR